MLNNQSQQKVDFKKVISHIMKILPKIPHDLIQISKLANQCGIEKRRLYDLMNALVACGICSKPTQHSYLWHGFGASKQTLVSIFKEFFSYSQENLSNAILLKNAPTIGTVTSSYLSIFAFFLIQNLSIRNASIILSGDFHSTKSVLRRLYLVTYILECVGLITKTTFPGDYCLAFNVKSIALEGLTQMASESLFSPETIEAQMHHFNEAYMKSLIQTRHSLLMQILEEKPSEVNTVMKIKPENIEKDIIA